MAERIRLAVKAMKAEGASDIQIMEEVISALKEDSEEVDFSETETIIENDSEESKRTINSENDLKQETTELIREIGIPASLLGFRYAREAIILALKEPTAIDRITKEVYPEIAKNNETTSSRVERAIRHAVEVAWERGDVNVLSKYFGYTICSSRGKPTNSEFIAMTAEVLRLRLKLS